MLSYEYFYDNKSIHKMKIVIGENYMEENNKIKTIVNNLKGNRRNITVNEMNLSECGKYQELNGSWVIWMLISGIILCFKNLYSGIALIIISVIIFFIYKIIGCCRFPCESAIFNILGTKCFNKY